MTTRGWHRCAVIYRVLVVAQTLGWAATSLARIAARQPRLSLGAQPLAVALTIASVLAIAAGGLSYYLRRTQSHDRDAVILAWMWFQVAGFSALAGYAASGGAICFVVGILALVVMHAFSPNRFQHEPGT